MVLCLYIWNGPQRVVGQRLCQGWMVGVTGESHVRVVCGSEKDDRKGTGEQCLLYFLKVSLLCLGVFQKWLKEGAVEVVWILLYYE
jgi:hypothetical protein